MLRTHCKPRSCSASQGRFGNDEKYFHLSILLTIVSLRVSNQEQIPRHMARPAFGPFKIWPQDMYAVTAHRIQGDNVAVHGCLDSAIDHQLVSGWLQTLSHREPPKRKSVICLHFALRHMLSYAFFCTTKMEAIGVAASAVTLAALFSNCIDCFHYFKAAQNCSAEAKTLLVKLDCEKARLLVWGNTVGILRPDYKERYPQLRDSESLIGRCIEQIISLLTDAQRLQIEYGSRQTAQLENQHYMAVVSVNSMNMFKTTKGRFFARAGKLNEAPNLLSRIKWAIRDGAKFRILLSHLKEFVDNIIELVPVALDVINSTVEGDITTIIDISTLRLAESGCEESYPSWSARASEVIRESEIGTLDRRNLEEILRDADEPGAANNASEANKNQDFRGKPRIWRSLTRLSCDSDMVILREDLSGSDR